MIEIEDLGLARSFNYGPKEKETNYEIEQTLISAPIDQPFMF